MKFKLYVVYWVSRSPDIHIDLFISPSGENISKKMVILQCTNAQSAPTYDSQNKCVYKNIKKRGIDLDDAFRGTIYLFNNNHDLLNNTS